MFSLFHPFALFDLFRVQPAGPTAKQDLAALREMFAADTAFLWLPKPGYLYEDSAGTIPATVNGVVGLLHNQLAVNPPVVTQHAINGGFDTDSDWTKGTGWAISSGVAAKTAGTASLLSQSQTLTAGVVYVVTYTVTRTVGTVTLQLTGGTTVNGTARSTSGTYTDYLAAVSGNNAVAFSAGSTFAGSIDNVTVTTVTNGGVIQQTTANKPYLRLTPTTGRYWLDGNTATANLTATFPSSLGSSCTIARLDPELGVVWQENQTIGITFNLITPYSYGGPILVINRALTAAEKAIVERVMMREMPALGNELVVNGTFDTDTTSWLASGFSGDWTNPVLSIAGGRLKIQSKSTAYGIAVQTIAVSTSKQYHISVNIYKGTASYGQLRPGSTVYGIEYGWSNSVVDARQTRSIKPISSVLYLQLMSVNENDAYSYFDNASVKEII